jgi:hypothetical protein
MFYKDLLGKKAEPDFERGDVTSDAVLLFLWETESRLSLIKRVVNVLRHSRHPAHVKHRLEEMLRQRMFQSAFGFEDADGYDELRHDPKLKMACEKQLETDPPLASQPTM